MPFLHVTTRIEGREGEELFFEKGGRGFPYLVFLDDSGDVIATPGAREVEAFDKTLSGDVNRFLDLRAKASAGDAAAVIDFALLEGTLGRVAFASVEKRLAGKELSAEQQKTFASVRAIGIFNDARKILNEGGRGNQDALRTAGAKLAGLLEEGVAPPGRDRQMTFYGVLMQYGFLDKKPEIAQAGLDGMKPHLPKDNPQVAPWVKMQQDRIDGLKADAEKPETEGDETEKAEGG